MKKLFISVAIIKPNQIFENDAQALKLQTEICHAIEEIDEDLGEGDCTSVECGSCILGEDNLAEFKDWCKPNDTDSITLSCVGCIHVVTVYCEHCLRGIVVKDFYETEVT